MRNTLVVTMLAVGMLTSSAHADPLTISDISGGWSSYTGGLNVAVANNGGQATDTMRWGDGTSPESGYDFTPGADLVGVPLGVAFSLGGLTHLNDPIPVGSGIDTASYDLWFSTNGTPSSLMTTLTFDHHETPNWHNPCADGGANWVGGNSNGCADIITVGAASLSSPIDVGGLTYYFDLLGFSIDGGTTFDSQFKSPERGSSPAELFGIVRTHRVPEPSTLALFGSGLLGIAAMVRRRRRAATSTSS